MAEWQFRDMGRDEIRSDPVEGEFFTPERLAEALVRESVQNSLDAKRDSTVRVRFSFSGEDAGLTASDAKFYLQGLIPHLTASNPEETERLRQHLTYIAIEDFGTHGLSGDPSCAIDSIDAQAKNDFYYFWRNIGRSVKSETDRGRWGLGKTVFPATSWINTFFALSISAGDVRPTLMGQSVLTTHTFNGNLFSPYGYFANFEDDGFAMPIRDQAAVTKFKRDFRLSRNDETGLSVIVPFPRADDLRHEDVVRFAILHYFYPILSGELILEFAWNGQSTTLDRGSLRNAASLVDWKPAEMSRQGIEATLDLASWAIGLRESDFVSLRTAGEESIPKWDTDLIDPESLTSLQARFEGDERIAIRVPIMIELARPTRKVTSFFEMFFERDARLAHGEDHYIRQGLTISGIHTLHDRKVRGFVVVRDPGLSALLGDTENPAHTEWQDRSGRLRAGYIHGPSRLRFVKKSLPSMVQLLSHPPSGLDEHLLEDVFSIDLAQEEEPATVRPAGGGIEPGDEPEEPPRIDLPKAVPPFEIRKTPGGFRITGNADGVVLGLSVNVEVAYHVRKGNPFKKYQPFDFELGAAPIRITTTGATIDSTVDNKMRITAVSPEFGVEVTGFDHRRDLRIRATPTGGEP